MTPGPDGGTVGGAAVTPGPSRALPGGQPSSTERATGWRERLRGPAAQLFEFELEQGRVRLGALGPLSRWLCALGLATVGLLLVSIIVVGVLAHGALETVRTATRTISVHSGTVAVTLVFLAIAWLLIVHAASRSSRSLRVLAGLLFFLTNSVLVDSLPVLPTGNAAANAMYDVAKVSLLGVPLTLFALACPTGGAPSTALVRALRATACLFTLAFFASLLAAERVGSGSAGVRGGLAAGIVQDLGTLVLLLAPLLSLSGMAVLSLAYGVGTAAVEVLSGARRAISWVLAVGLLGAEGWFFGWRDRANLWPGSHGWVILLHAVPVVSGFAVIALLAREVHALPAEPVRDNASASIAFLVGVPVIVSGLYFTLFTASTIGFLHIPSAVGRDLYSSVGSVLNTTEATGPRCILFGAVAVAAVAVLCNPRMGARRRQFAVGLALMSGWISWLVFIDWLPGTDTADESLLSLVVLVLVAGYLASKWRRWGEIDLARVAGVLGIVWLFDGGTGLLRSLSHLVPVEGAAVLVAGVVLVLLGKSQFTGGTSPRLPRDARVALWTGYIVLSLCVAYWAHGVAGFAANNTEVSVFSFIAVPYMVWLVISGRFSTQVLKRRTPGPEGSSELAKVEHELRGEHELREQSWAHSRAGTEPPGTRQTGDRWRPVAAGALCAALLAGGGWAAYAIDRSGVPQPVAITDYVGIMVPHHWSVQRYATFAVATHRGPTVTFVAFVRTSAVQGPVTTLSSFLAGQTLFEHLEPSDLTTFALGPGGNFSVVALAKFGATYAGHPVAGDAFALLNPTTGLVAEGAAWASAKRDLTSLADQIASMEQSLNTVGSGPMW